MIPILYESNEPEVSFQSDTTLYTFCTSNGIGRLIDVISGTGKVTEEVNGVFECEFQYPISGQYYSEIQEGRIVVVKTCNNDIRRHSYMRGGAPVYSCQPFVIYGRSEEIDGKVTFYAQHISYKTRHIMCKPYARWTRLDDIVNGIYSNLVDPSMFQLIFDDDFSKSQEDVLYIQEEPKSLRSILLDTDDETSLKNILDSQLSTNIEYIFDGFNIIICDNRGRETTAIVRYRKNLLEYSRNVDISGTYNAYYPFWKPKQAASLNLCKVLSGDGRMIFSPGPSPSEIKAIPLDLSEYFEEEPSEDQMRRKTSELVNQILKESPWKEKETLRIKFNPETDIEFDSKILGEGFLKGDLGLGDFITVINEKSNYVREHVEIRKVTYDFLAEKYISMEAGDEELGLGETIYSSNNKNINDSIPSSGTITLSSISIVASPFKTIYVVGDSLDLRGITVRAAYSDGSTLDVTNYCEYTPASGTVLDTAGQVTITVSYTEGQLTKTASTEVTVTASMSGTGTISYTWDESTRKIAVARTSTSGNASYSLNNDELTIQNGTEPSGVAT